jgi:biotin operon repressor
MTDHVCIRAIDGKPTLVAIETPLNQDRHYAPVEHPISAELLGKYFVYDAEKHEYKRSDKEMPSVVKKEKIREHLYLHGFDIDGIHYSYNNKRDKPGEYFPMPKAVFRLGLDHGEIALLAFLMYCEDRKTFTCHPSYATIGEAIGMSNNTVKKYVDSLEKKGFIYTEPTMVRTRDGRAHNGNLQTGELRISRQVVKTGKSVEITAPKTKSSIRTILLPPDMVELLAELKKQTTGEWMFPSPVKEGEPRNPTAVYHRFQLILERSHCKKVRFHDLRHTFATMALENGMDIKTLSAMIGHISSETTLNIYSHITDTMQQQAAVRIDREIGGTNAEMPEPPPPKASDEPQPENATETVFEPYKPKIRKSGTGCVTMINDHLYEGRFTPRVNGKRISKNVYAKTREECEEKLADLIKTMKAEIAEMKKQAKNA